MTGQTAADRRIKRVVLGIDDEGNVRGIGPVYTDESVEGLRDEVEDAGWKIHGVVTLDSLSAFRTEILSRGAR